MQVMIYSNDFSQIFKVGAKIPLEERLNKWKSSGTSLAHWLQQGAPMPPRCHLECLGDNGVPRWHWVAGWQRCATLAAVPWRLLCHSGTSVGLQQNKIRETRVQWHLNAEGCCIFYSAVYWCCAPSLKDLVLKVALQSLTGSLKVFYWNNNFLQELMVCV